MTRIETLNTLLPWTEKEGDSNGPSLSRPIDALTNVRRAIKRITEFDGSPHTYEKSGYWDIGDMSTLFVAGTLYRTKLAGLVDFDLLFIADEMQINERNNKPYEREELYRIEGMETVLGHTILYHQIHKLRKDSEYFYAGRLARLNEPDWAQLFW